MLQRIATGDVEAFRVLFDEYRTGLYAAALKVTKSKYGAEEVVQEIFANLWEMRSGLADVDDPSSYIFTVAYNQSYRFLKKVSNDTELFQSLKYRFREAHNDTEEWLDEKETKQLIDRAVQKLPPQRQLIFKLSREKGLSHQQIAEQLRISPLTVKKQMVLALRNIRSYVTKAAPLIVFFALRSLF